MPELPEVETIKRGLASSLPLSTIKKITLSPLSHKLRLPLSPHTNTLLTSQTFGPPSHFQRRGKYLLIHLLNHPISLCIHLGMSGRILVSTLPPEPSPHNHVILHLTRSHKQHFLTYHDPRRFGFFRLLTPENPSLPALDTLGEEPFTLSPQTLLHNLSTRRIPIKNALLNPHIIAGIGNIYASEALYAASIHPLTPSHSLSLHNCSHLLHHLQNVLSLAIDAGGSSLRDHRQIDGSLGSFQHKWNVYNREGLPCPLCQHTIVRIKLSGRSTFFCPHHQK